MRTRAAVSITKEAQSGKTSQDIQSVTMPKQVQQKSTSQMQDLQSKKPNPFENKILQNIVGATGQKIKYYFIKWVNQDQVNICPEHVIRSQYETELNQFNKEYKHQPLPFICDQEARDHLVPFISTPQQSPCSYVTEIIGAKEIHGKIHYLLWSQNSSPQWFYWAKRQHFKLNSNKPNKIDQFDKKIKIHGLPYFVPYYKYLQIFDLKVLCSDNVDNLHTQNFQLCIHLRFYKSGICQYLVKLKDLPQTMAEWHVVGHLYKQSQLKIKINKDKEKNEQKNHQCFQKQKTNHSSKIIYQNQIQQLKHQCLNSMKVLNDIYGRNENIKTASSINIQNLSQQQINLEKFCKNYFKSMMNKMEVMQKEMKNLKQRQYNLQRKNQVAQQKNRDFKQLIKKVLLKISMEKEKKVQKEEDIVKRQITNKNEYLKNEDLKNIRIMKQKIIKYESLKQKQKKYGRHFIKLKRNCHINRDDMLQTTDSQSKETGMNDSQNEYEYIYFEDDLKGQDGMLMNQQRRQGNDNQAYKQIQRTEEDLQKIKQEYVEQYQQMQISQILVTQYFRPRRSMNRQINDSE